MAEGKRAKMEGRLPALINQAHVGLKALPELTLKVSERIYLIPNIAVLRAREIEEPYPTKPAFLCIEILSPEDRLADTVAKRGISCLGRPILLDRRSRRQTMLGI